MNEKLIQTTHAVTLVTPSADAFAGTVTSNVVNMRDHTHLTAYVYRGAAASGTSLITCQSSATSAGSSATAIPFRRREGTVSTQDGYGDEVDVTAAGYTTTAEKDNIIDIIEVNASDMDGTDEYLSIKAVEDVDHPVLGGIIGIMSGQRQKGNDTRSVRP